MRGVKFYDLVAIVEFLYFGEANIDQENLDSFLCLAEELQLQGLMERLEEKVADIETKVTSAVKRGNVSFKKQMSDEKESSTETENILAASSEPFVPFPLISGGLEKLEEQVKSLMEKGQNQSGTQNGTKSIQSLLNSSVFIHKFSCTANSTWKNSSNFP